MKSLKDKIKGQVINKIYCDTRFYSEISNPVIRRICNKISDNSRFKVLNKMIDEIDP